MVYDPDRKIVVLFGGRGSPAGPGYADTWEWDGTDWTLRTPATSPLDRSGDVFAWDPV